MHYTKAATLIRHLFFDAVKIGRGENGFSQAISKNGNPELNWYNTDTWEKKLHFTYHIIIDKPQAYIYTLDNIYIILKSIVIKQGIVHL